MKSYHYLFNLDTIYCALYFFLMSKKLIFHSIVLLHFYLLVETSNITTYSPKSQKGRIPFYFICFDNKYLLFF